MDSVYNSAYNCRGVILSGEFIHVSGRFKGTCFLEHYIKNRNMWTSRC